MNSRRLPPTSRVSRPSKRPMPCSSWTTRSPTLRSRKSERKLRARRPRPRGGVERDEGVRGLEGQGVLAPRALLGRPREERLGLGGDRLGVQRDRDRARQVLPRGNGRAGHEREKLRRLLFGEAAVELLQQA